MKLMGREEIPEPDTVGDWLRRMGDPEAGQRGLKGLDGVRDKINERILKRGGIEGYTLDPDATEIIGEKADTLLTYNGDKGYMPTFGFLYENPVCIYDEFREGNVRSLGSDRSSLPFGGRWCTWRAGSLGMLRKSF